MKTTNKMRRILAAAAGAAMLCTAIPFAGTPVSAATEDISATMKWGTLRIGGGGFVSGIVTGKKAMYARTDVGGAYKYNYDTDTWEQLLGFINDADRGLLSVDAMAIDPTDDNTVYFLCGCAYFSAEKTVIFKTTDGGKTFTETDVTDMIQVHGNGHGRQMGESIAIDPDNPDTIYCGGDVYAGDSCLIKSTDGGKTWKTVKSYGDLGLYQYQIKWPTWTSNMRNALTDGEYVTQNGISCIYIWDGTVYVGSSSTGKYNVVSASVKDDKFTDLSAKLDAKNIPGRITGDGQGNLFFAFQGAVCVGNGAASGSVKKLDTKTGTVTDISPLKHLYIKPSDEFAAPSEGGYSGVSVDPTNPKHMVCSTCGLFSNAQLWQPWDAEHDPCWGDKFFKSEDGGETWIETTPGLAPVWGQPPIADYLDDGGYAWIRNKAIHWVGAYVIDPVKPDRSLATSGNGVFMCSNTWDETPQFSFHPDGIEEVVALDFVSTPDGLNLSAIGDYDGFVHEAVDKIGLQYQPNMGSTSAIAVCPQNTDVWARIAEGDNGSGYYTTDRGKTWNDFTAAVKGGKLAIAEIAEGKYRVFNTGKNDGGVQYSDDWGKTWNKCEGIPSQYGSKPTMLLVEPDDPNTVYAYATYFNSSWHYSKPEPDETDAQYIFCISTDGGKTFNSTNVCMYDQCDSAGRIGYLGKGELMLGGGWYGMYRASVKDGKATITKVDGISYCKTLGYGAPEKTGGVNTIYMYGKPLDSDPEGIYRSTDVGKTWVCINTDRLYGGTGNGNYLVGDMSTFGRVYMSTVGCGIVYGEIAGTTPVTPPATTTTTAADDDILWGDADCSGLVDVSDAVLVCRVAVEDRTAEITDKGQRNADVTHDGSVKSDDALKIVRFVAKLLTAEDLAKK